MFETIGDDINYLCTLLGCSPGQLQRSVLEPTTYCQMKTVRRRRKSGRPRIVWKVKDPLRRLQRKIALWLLPHVNAMGKHVTAFRDGATPFANATQHLGRKFVLNADLADFYGSIDLIRVVQVFESLEVSRAVSVLLGRLCVMDERLMQGGRASPFVANLAARNLDRAILDSLRNDCVYTRYVDDMTISSDTVDALPTRDELSKIVDTAGFRLRENTYNIRAKKGGPYVTGLYVGGESPRIPRRLRRRIERFLHFAKRTTPEHAAYISFRGRRLEDSHAAAQRQLHLAIDDN